MWAGVGELLELEEEAPLWMPELVLGMAVLEEFLSLLSLCFGRTTLWISKNKKWMIKGLSKGTEKQKRQTCEG